MAPSSPFSLLLRHIISHKHSSHYHLSLPFLVKHFSLSSDPSQPPSSSLSDRLSLVFEKIDAIEKDRSDKDAALQRIRAFRQSKSQSQSQLGLGLGSTNELPGFVEKEINEEKEEKVVELVKREVELAHPWREWVELMEMLVKQNYFDHRRKDEDKMIGESFGSSVDVGEDVGGVELEGIDFTRDWKTVHTAVLNFGRDRFDIFRSLSRQDIQILVGYGCPSADKKVVFSSKLLRKHAHLDEGDVCSSCSLRNSCDRAYLVTNKEDEARTIDVMRVLLTYGFDPINGSVENKSLLKQKSVKSVVRKLLHEVARLSAVPIDPNLPPPVIKQRPPKVKQPPPPPKKRVGRDDIEMKKGDWLCPKCNFMNFAKNVVCLQCDAKRPKRELLPGEWECPQCNFLNYRRNMSCFNCEHKRPPDEYMENQMQGRQQNRPVGRPERVANRVEVSNAWNFDFDDDESDGADVAAFEYADARVMNEDRLLDSEPENANFSRVRDEGLSRQGRTFRSHDEGLSGQDRTPRYQERENPRPAQMVHRTGFDDFDDEDDDVDSYEVDNQNRNQQQESSSVRFSDVEGYSESENDDDLPVYSAADSSSFANSSRALTRKGAFSESRDKDMDFDSDEDLPVHPKWKSSHVADSGRRDRGSRGPSKRRSFRSDDDDRLAFGSDNDLEEDSPLTQGRGRNRNFESSGFGSDGDLEEDFPLKQGRGHNRNFGTRGFRQGDNSNRARRQNGFGSDDDLEEDFSSKQGRGNNRNLEPRGFRRGDDSNRGRRQNEFRGGGRDVNFVKGNEFNDEFGRSSRGSRGGRRGSFGDDRHGARSMNGRQRGRQDFKGSGGTGIR